MDHSWSNQSVYCTCRNSFICPEHLSQHYTYQNSELADKFITEVDSNLIKNFKSELILRIKSYSELKKIRVLGC